MLWFFAAFVGDDAFGGRRAGDFARAAARFGADREFRFRSGRLLYRSTSNPFAPVMVTSGRRATGPGATTTAITTGFRAPGSRLRKSAFCGLHRTGDGATARFFFMTAIGARKLGSTEASTTASAILEKVSLAGVGTMDTSSTTGQ